MATLLQTIPYYASILHNYHKTIFYTSNNAKNSTGQNEGPQLTKLWKEICNAIVRNIIKKLTLHID